MEELLNKLYSYEYFGVYLMISILVLVVLFIVILFFGKKDQKNREIEATKKLQQIENDTFKEDSIENAVEVNTLSQETLENDTIIVPNINTIETDNDLSDEIPEPVLPVQEEVVEEIKDVTTNEIIEPLVESESVEEPAIEPVIETEEPMLNTEIMPMEAPIVEEKHDEIPMPTIEPVITNDDVNEITPLLEKIEEKPLLFNDEVVEENKYEVPIIETTEPEIKVEPVIEEVEVPTFNFDELMKDIEETKKEEPVKAPEIFSSVFVPEKEEEPKIEEKENVSSELDFELPTLKKEVQEETKVEEKIEMPVLTDYNLDNLAGETYTINK